MVKTPGEADRGVCLPQAATSGNSLSLPCAPPHIPVLHVSWRMLFPLTFPLQLFYNKTVSNETVLEKELTSMPVSLPSPVGSAPPLPPVSGMSRGTGPGCPGAVRLFGGGLLLRREGSTDPTASAVVWGLLLSGRVLVPGSLTVSTLEPGDLFGAAALYNDSPRLCHHPHRPRDLPLPPAGPGAAGPPSGGGGPAAPELSDLSHRPHPLPQRPAGFPGCGGYGGPGGPYLLSSLSYGVVSAPPPVWPASWASAAPRCIGPSGTWNRPA